jgi:hypothetical protein
MWESSTPEPVAAYAQYIVWAVLVTSEVLAFFVIRQAWRSPRSPVEKCVLTVLAMVPVAGLFFAWWIQNDPGPAAPAFRDHRLHQLNVLQRWQHVFEEQDPDERARKFAQLVATTKDDL